MHGSVRDEAYEGMFLVPSCPWIRFTPRFMVFRISWDSPGGYKDDI